MDVEESLELSVLISTDGNHSPQVDRDFQNAQALLTSVMIDNLEALTAALNQSSSEALRWKFSGYNFKNIVTIACELPYVSENVFEMLFRHFAINFPHLDLSEERWYYWEPVHFAAYNVDVTKLRVVLRNIAEYRVNSLTLFSENALHVLLEYGKCVESFNVQLSNGWEGRNCHVIAQEQPELVECARELLDSGVDVNHANIWSETPLLIAIRYRMMAIIELLLRRRDIDLDTARDPYSHKTARELLKENEIYVSLLGLAVSPVSTPVKTLFLYLKSEQEELFLRYNNENIREYSNDLDGDNENNTSGTMIQLCLLKGYIEYVKEVENSTQNDNDLMNSAMLRVFCQKGFVRSVEHLLKNGAQVTKHHRLFSGLSCFELAVKFGYYPFLAVLLQHNSNQIDPDAIVNALKRVCEPSMSIGNNIKHVFYLLLSRLETLYENMGLEAVDYDYDDRGVLNTLLDIYLRHNSNNKYEENICQVLRLGASLIDSSENLTKLERVTLETLSAHLDDCMNLPHSICCDSFILDEQSEYSEIKFLRHLSRDAKKKELLTHPALIYLIHAKWLRTKKFFQCNIAFYSLFLISLYVYMVCLELNQMNSFVKYSFVFLVATHSFKELVQLCLFHRRYFSDLSNYIEAVIMVCCYVNIVYKEPRCMILAILLSTLVFLLMLGQLPKFTKYMIVFSSTKYFFEYAAFYFLQFFSFALCFFILLPDEESSGSDTVGKIFSKLFDTLVFFIGQYDGPITDPPEFPVFGRVIVAMFVFCMTIILNNLLVGLIVTDMDAIQKTSKLIRQVKMIKYVEKIETFMERMRGWCFCETYFGNTRVFKAGAHKIMPMNEMQIFDEDDRIWLKEIYKNRKLKRKVLPELYDHITNEVYGEHKSHKGNKDILQKLARLEEELSRISK